MSGDARRTWLVAAVALALGCGGARGDADGACAACDAAADAAVAMSQAGSDGGSDRGAAGALEVAVDIGLDAFDVAAERSSDAELAEAARADAPPDTPAREVGAATGCVDNRKDGQETDIDCGGPACPKCGLDQGCLADSDCGAWPGCDVKKGGCACDAVAHKCVVNHCVDHKQNVGETGIDCGGGECAGCAPGVACALHSDCASGGCDLLSMTCATSHCADHVQDVDETGVDCGGDIKCPRCALGVACLLDFDCASSACDGISATCVADRCADHHVDGNETDVDCGGPTCAPCPVGRKCHGVTDCAPGLTCTAPPTAVCETP